MEIQEKVLSPIEKGIKLIGIGKHGSKKLPAELVEEITSELKLNTTNPLLVGAFFGALMMKEIDPSYYQLEEFSGRASLNDAHVLYKKICADAPSNMKHIGVKLLNKQTLTVDEAYATGKFLFSDEPGESLRGMVVSILRIRYETKEEYEGIYDALVEEIDEHFPKLAGTKPVIQLAEPFDGAEHSYMITPLLAHALQKDGYTVISICGRSGGPKMTLNTSDLYKGLKGSFLKRSTTELKTPDIGWALDLKDIYWPLEEWVNRRRILMKRPFLATLEKVLNPVHADILITSVFHIPYLEKMVELGIMAGFNSVIVLKRGLEGTLAPSLSKAAGILCATKTADGSVITRNFDASEETFLAFRAETDDVIENISVEKNIQYIKQYLAEGKTNDPDFDLRVGLAIALYKKGVQWIAQTRAAD